MCGLESQKRVRLFEVWTEVRTEEEREGSPTSNLWSKRTDQSVIPLCNKQRIVECVGHKSK